MKEFMILNYIKERKEFLTEKYKQMFAFWERLWYTMTMKRKPVRFKR